MENQAHEHEDLITTFIDITSSSRPEAQFFLESHNFDLDSAVSTFLETSSDNNNPIINPDIATTTAAAAVASRSHSSSYAPSEDSDDSPLSRSRSPSPIRSNRSGNYSLRSSANKKTATSSCAGGRVTSRIQTFADLNKKEAGDGSDSDPDFQPNVPEYYTGGEKSGMVVQDRPKANDGDSIFNAARNSGAVISGEHSRPSSSSRSFSGTARLLSGDTVLPAPQQPEERNHIITLWNNGFTVDDGPLRRLDDPQNGPFLQSIFRGECPEELQSSARGGKVKVSLTRKEENYQVTEARRPTSFQGVARTLNSSSSNITSTIEQTAPAATPLTPSPAPTMGLFVDQSLPTTSLQLRLADGTRMVSRFNFHHTVRDIRGFIDASRPGGSSTYQLQTMGFPPKQLNELEQTIEQAGLANSVVIQKLG